MDEPIISVIVPIYNVAPYLHHCLDSIRAQTFSALDIILIDDGSQDGCGEICDEYAKMDTRIRVFHQMNQGLSAARNHGLDWASCDLVAFVDGDDWIEPDMYQTLYDNLLSADADVSTCAHDRGCAGKASCAPIVVRDQEAAMLAVLEDPCVGGFAWNKLYKKKLFHSVRYPVGKLYEDSYIILDLLEGVTRMVSTYTPMYHYTMRPDSITTKAYHPGEEDRVHSALKNLEWAKRKHPGLIRVAKVRCFLAHYHCLEKILHGPANAYPDKQKEHLRFLRRNFPFILFACPKACSFHKPVSFYMKILCPRFYQFLRQKLKNASFCK